MVKPVTQVNTQFFSSVSCENWAKILNFLNDFLVWIKRLLKPIKHIADKQGVLRQDVYIFFFFRRGSYESSYSLYTFLLEGEVNILKKNCSTSQCFYVQSRTINRQYNSVLANFVKLPANLWSREDILNCLYNYFKDLIMCAQSKL